MKGINRIWSVFVFIIFILTTITLFAGETIPPGADSVTMPWSSFIKLRDAAREDYSSRTSLFAYDRALYEGEAEIRDKDYIIHFKVTITIRTWNERALLVPVLSAGLKLENLHLNDKQATWQRNDGSYAVLVPHSGKHTITVAFSYILDTQIWPRSFSLPLIRVPCNDIILSVPDRNIEVRLEPGVVQSVQGTKKGTTIRGSIPFVPQSTVSWLKKGEEKRDIPLKMGASVLTYISLEERGATCSADITFRILQGETNVFSISVPSWLDILKVTPDEGDNVITQWYTEESEKSRKLIILSAYRHNKLFRLKLLTEKTESGAGYSFTMPRIEPLEVERFEHLISVGSGTNVEISKVQAIGVEERDVRFLPSDLQALASDRALFYYKSLQDDFEIKFDVKSHERAAVVTTVLELAHFDTVLTESGTMMTKVIYRIKNNQAQFFRLRFPEKSKLLSANLKGQEIQPAREGNNLLIPLEKSTSDTFTIELAYLSEADPFGVIGWNGIELPEHELPINQLRWNLYISQRFQVLRFFSNIDRVKHGWRGEVQSIMNSISSLQPKPAFAGNDSSSSQTYEYNTEGLKKRFKKAQLDDETYADKSQILNQIQVQIPITGLRYSFESYLVKGFIPRISFVYMNEKVKGGLAFLFSAIFFIVTLWFLLFIFDRTILPPFLRKWSVVLVALVLLLLGVIKLLIISFGLSGQIFTAILVGMILFAFWQNRRLAAQYRETGSKPGVWFSRLLLLGLVLAVFIFFPIGGLIACGFICVVSILFHALQMKGNILYTAVRRRKDALSIFLLLSFCFLHEGGVLPLSEASSNVPPNEQIFTPDLPDAEITISWPLMEELLRRVEERQKRRKDTPDFDFLFGEATLIGHINPQFVTLKVTVPLSIVTRHFVHIPFLSEPVVLKSASLDGKPIVSLVREGTVGFEIQSETDKSKLLMLELVVPVTKKGGVHRFAVKSPLFQAGTLKLSFGEDVKSIQLNGVAWQRREGRSIQAALGSSQQLSGELATFQRQREMIDDQSTRVKKMYSTTYTLLTLEEEIATCYSSIRYRILNDQVQEFSFSLPGTVTVHEIVGEDLQNWILERENSGGCLYRVKTLYPVRERYDLSVQYERVLKKDETSLIIPDLKVSDVARDIGYIGVELHAQAEISVKSIDKARIIDIQELPAIINEDALAPFVYAFRYVEHPHAIILDMIRHETAQMDPAVADQITYTCVISPQGKMVAQARLLVRNSQKQFASFILPEGARLLSTFMDNVTVKASIGSKGDILLPLKRQSGKAFVLDVIYEGQDVPLSWLGRSLQFILPRIDIPASMVSAEFYIPRRTHFSKPDRESDFQPTTVSGYIPWGTLTGFVGSASLSRSMDQRQEAVPSANIPAATIQSEEDGQVRQQASFVSGLYSLRIEIPKRGRKLSLTTFYVPSDRSLKAVFFTCHQYLYLTVLAFMGIILVITGFIISIALGMSLRYFAGGMLVSLIILILFPLSWQIAILCMAGGFTIDRIRKRTNKEDS
ncbi:hypothetical protein ACFL27_17895 [candidate division CSSED10-310 bacterium]|uniref:Uncharacterized protein n=1 Tax=candidate division CSSED10-310 bacterium TaxID=2855610 RepID=A0ABV6Z0U8_UNCC1